MAKYLPGRARPVLLLWVLVGFFYFYLSYDYITTSMNDRAFKDYLTSVVKLAGIEGRPAREIRALLLVRAEELGLPIRGNQITILGNGTTLKVAVDYEVAVQIPGIVASLYHLSFQHDAAYKSP